MTPALQVEDKMRAAGQSELAIRSFLANFHQLGSGTSLSIPESSIDPVETVPEWENLPDDGKGINRTVMIKLNGGLGTSMGLHQAKSLLEIKDGLSFLDLIARQILHFRSQGHPDFSFLLMNSFRTSADSRAFLSSYPDLGDPNDWEFMQSQVPKIDVATGLPVHYPDDPELEWCPPGHGDLYTALAGSGKLDELLAKGKGIDYAFISNSDNLGAVPSSSIPAYMDREGLDFLMEVTRRTASDKKGGHLASRKGQLVLREAAQCPEADEEYFQDIDRHRYFNTNNLWIRLSALKEKLDQGPLSLPLIVNRKTVDPADKSTTPVYQLETAMGAAIACFERSGALAVPRTRFAPVKKTSDLMVLRSDASVIGPDTTLQLIPERNGIPPQVNLPGDYKNISDFDRLVKVVPSLKECTSLTVIGPVLFDEPMVIRGDVTLTPTAPS